MTGSANGKSAGSLSICAIRCVRVSFAIQRPQSARFVEHVGGDDELAALVFAAPYVIGRVLLQRRFLVCAERLFSPVGARYRIQYFPRHRLGHARTQEAGKTRKARLLELSLAARSDGRKCRLIAERVALQVDQRG